VIVGPQLGRGRATFIHDYPASQAALARVRPGPWPVAARFELYLDGVELANGFEELADAAEQRRRFEADNAERARRGLPVRPLDERFLARSRRACRLRRRRARVRPARHGRRCATRIDEVIAFPVELA